MAQENFSAKEKRKIKKGRYGMYKELIICLFIVILVIVLNVVTQNYAKASIEEITYKLNLCKEEGLNERKDTLKQKTQDVIEVWNNKYETLAFYIEHNELEKVKIELVSLEANVQTEEFEQAVVDINRANFLLEHIMQKISLQFKNIF